MKLEKLIYAFYFTIILFSLNGYSSQVTVPENQKANPVFLTNKNTGRATLPQEIVPNAKVQEWNKTTGPTSYLRESSQQPYYRAVWPANFNTYPATNGRLALYGISPTVNPTVGYNLGTYAQLSPAPLYYNATPQTNSITYWNTTGRELPRNNQYTAGPYYPTNNTRTAFYGITPAVSPTLRYNWGIYENPSSKPLYYNAAPQATIVLINPTNGAPVLYSTPINGREILQVPGGVTTLPGYNPYRAGAYYPTNNARNTFYGITPTVSPTVGYNWGLYNDPSSGALYYTTTPQTSNILYTITGYETLPPPKAPPLTLQGNNQYQEPIWNP